MRDEDSSSQPATFWAFDIHVHTPASKDTKPDKYGATTPEEVVEAAIAAGLDTIAVTDHNTAEWVDAMARAAEGTSLTVLPGVELTTTEGHLLGIWETGTDAQVIKDVLVKLGINSSDHGKLDISAEVGFIPAAESIVNSGGLAIAAHIDKPKGLLKLSVAAHRKRILNHPALCAVEVTEDETAQKVGRQITRAISVVQSSDSMEPRRSYHTVAGIGSRRTWIKAGAGDLRGLRHAIDDPQLRVRLEQPPSPEHSRIQHLTAHGGFLDGQRFDFADDLTSLLGGTGTGKSLAIELIRFALDQQTNGIRFPAIRNEVDNRLRRALGTDSVVELVYLDDADQRHTVRRVFDEAGSPPPEFDTPGVATIPRIRAFSQGEIIEYAREPVGRMSLVDSGIELTDIEDGLKQAYGRLQSTTEELFTARHAVASAAVQLEELPTIEARVKSLSELFEDEVVEQQEGWTKELRFYRKLDSLIPEGPHISTKAAKPSPKSFVPSNEDLRGQVVAALDEFSQAIKDAEAAVEDAAQRANRKLVQIQAQWDARHKQFDKQLLEQLKTTGEDSTTDLPTLRSQLASHQERLAELNELASELRSVLRREVRRLARQRHQILGQIEGLKRERFNRRDARVKTLNGAMKNRVRIKILQYHDDKEFAAKLGALARGSGLGKLASTIAEHADPAKLVSSMLDDDAEAVSEATGVEVARIENLFSHIRDSGLEEDFSTLQDLDLDDALKVEFKIAESGRWADIEDLAHGQKCTAILILAFAEGDSPLLIDQPEDALHAPWIEEYLVDHLRTSRGDRQYLFATRSPGLVVSADSEMLITLTSDSNRGSIEAAGSLERHELNKLALYHLEGGRDPFRRRQKKLGDSL